MYASRKDVTVISPTDSLDLSVFVGTTLVARMISPPRIQSPSHQQVDAWRQALIEWDKTLGPRVISAMSSAPTVRNLPSIGPVYVDSRRNIWVGSYVGPGKSSRNWRIVSSTGRPIGTIELPAVIDPILPSKSEILDVYGDLLALVAHYGDRTVVEVRRIVP
jgi:hypothetical protein